MKKLSIREKAARYDEALEKARQLCTYPTSKPFISDLQDLFPELKENEDGRMRKWIINYLSNRILNSSIIAEKANLKKAIAWLEKQEGCEHIKKDWLEHLKQSWYKEGFIDGKYSNKTPKESEDDWIRKEIINYLKEKGDFRSCWISWLEKQGKQIDFANREYWRGYREGKQEILDKYADFEKQSEQKPTVEMKTPEESLGIDSDTYNKIVDECIYGEQKPWSEEDEKMLNLIIARLHSHPNVDLEEYSKEYGWLNYSLKSPKEKVLPQPKQEWSEEDEEMFNRCIKTMKGAYYRDGKALYWLENRFKSLKSQNTWKPSDEQMEVLLGEANAWTKGCPKQKILESLYNDLKKLKRIKLWKQTNC